MRPARFLRPCLAALLATAAACSVGPPHVTPPNGGESNDASVGTAWADSVLVYVQSGVSTSCAAGLPDCVTTMIQTGDCADNAVLGPMDGMSWTLNPGDTITIGFKCSSITEVGAIYEDGGLVPSPDFQIFGTSTAPAYTIVEVSADDQSFYSVNRWDKLGSATNPTFDLMYTTQATSNPMPLAFARYVRISQVGSGSAVIDAIESLRAIK